MITPSYTFLLWLAFVGHFDWMSSVSRVPFLAKLQIFQREGVGQVARAWLGGE